MGFERRGDTGTRRAGELITQYSSLITSYRRSAMVGARGGSLSRSTASDAGSAGLLTIARSYSDGVRDCFSCWLLRRIAGGEAAGRRKASAAQSRSVDRLWA